MPRGRPGERIHALIYWDFDGIGDGWCLLRFFKLYGRSMKLGASCPYPRPLLTERWPRLVRRLG